MEGDKAVRQSGFGILPGSCSAEPFRLVEGAAKRLLPSLGTGSRGGELMAALELNSV